MIDEGRCRRLVRRAIQMLELDLRGLTVLTEAATSYYIFTPMIAALAGAERVLALTRDSVYGAARDIESESTGLAHRWGVGDRVDVLVSRDDPRIAHADIVTNVAMVRPLDRPLLHRLKPTAVIPLMFETWEFRPHDLDLPECRRLGIPVLGTDEHHPDLQIFGYIGHLALKLLYSLDIEVFRTPVAVLGAGEFADQVTTRLTAAGAKVTAVGPGPGAGAALREALAGADALVVVEHHDRGALIGPQGLIDAEELRALTPDLAVAHICGGADRSSLEEAGFRLAPGRFAPPGYMSVALEYAGPRALIDLNAAGLKVGERLARAREAGRHGLEAELAVLAETPVAQGFTGYHDRAMRPTGGDDT